MSYAAAINHLKLADKRLAAHIKMVGPCTLEISSRQPWQALLRAVAHQQLNGKAAESIFARFLALYPNKRHPNPSDILATPPAKLRNVGFSEAKVMAILDIAAKAEAKAIPTRKQCEKMTDAEIIAALVPLRGVGRWTVEMLLIFTLGRMDVLPVDDFGVREGYRLLMNKKEQEKPKDLTRLGQKWAPYRTLAAWYLWRRADMAKEK